MLFPCTCITKVCFRLFPCVTKGTVHAFSQARVSAHSCRDPGKLAWAECFSCDGEMTLSANHSSCLVFTTHSTGCWYSWGLEKLTHFLEIARDAGRQSANHAASSCAVSGCEAARIYRNVESSIIIKVTSVKKCSAQARLPGSLKPCAETLACEDDFMLFPCIAKVHVILFPCITKVGLHSHSSHALLR